MGFGKRKECEMNEEKILEKYLKYFKSKGLDLEERFNKDELVFVGEGKNLVTFEVKGIRDRKSFSSKFTYNKQLDTITTFLYNALSIRDLNDGTVRTFLM